VISYALVMIVSLTTGQPTQAFVEGPMSDSWCSQLIERYAYNAQDGTSVRVPTCLSWPEAQQMLVQNACTRASWTDRHRRRLFDCTAATDVMPTAAVPTPQVSRVAAVHAAASDAFGDQAQTASDATAPPAEPPAPAERTPPLPEPKQFHLGAAAAALVAQAHTQMNKAGYDLASATIERAVRIEPNNPLLWVELAQMRLSAGDAAQADGISRRALALSEGDGRLQGMAWHVIAESLRARGRNSEAAEADRQATALAAQ
jgi:tetratricopeptide (TPR) repeat protein